MPSLLTSRLLTIFEGTDQPWTVPDLLFVVLVDDPLDRETVEEAIAALLAADLVEIKGATSRITLTDGGESMLRRARLRKGDARLRQLAADIEAAAPEPTNRWSLSEEQWEATTRLLLDYQRDRVSARLHVVDGLLVALRSWDDVGAVVQRSRNRPAALQAVIESFGLSEVQANHVLDTRLAQRTEQAREDLEADRAALASELTALEDPQPTDL